MSNYNKKSYPHYTQVIHNFCGYVIEGLLQNPSKRRSKSFKRERALTRRIDKVENYLKCILMFHVKQIICLFKFHVSCETV